MNSEHKNTWVFRLFVSERNPNTERAVALLEEICQDYLDGKCDIKVIDVVKNPLAAMEENILATPTLIKKLPLPERRIIGDLTDKDKLLSVLEIFPNIF